MLIAALVAMLWLDQWLADQPAPNWLPAFLARSGNIAPGLVLLPLALFLGVLASRELAILLRAKGVRTNTPILSLATIAGMAAVSAGAQGPGSLGYAVAVLAIAALDICRTRDPIGAMTAIAGAMLAFVHLGVMLGFLLALRQEHSAWLLLFILVTTKACDIGAFFTGKAIGKHKLIPWLSPKKTWEGLVGGVLASIAIALAGWSLVEPVKDAPLLLAIPTGLIIALVAQAGDLAISLYKRDAAAKDSGQSLPGFGGILDIIDSPLLVGPFAYAWLALII